MAMTTAPPDIESAPQYHEVQSSRTAEDEELENDVELSASLIDRRIYPNPLCISSETTPLIPRKWHTGGADAKKQIGRILRNPFTHIVLVSIATFLITLLVYRHFSGNSAVDRDRSREDTRREWEREERAHEKKVLEWKNEIADYEKQEASLLDHLGVLRNETAHHVEENERLSREAVELEQRATEAERKTREAERKEEDALEKWEEYNRRLKWEKGQRAKLNLHWVDLLGDDHCRGHDDIHYRALLGNMAPELDAVEACRDTNVTINGIFYERPEWCEDVGNSNVYGHWTVRNEAKCLSYWDSFKDKGCTTSGSGLRRFEATLGGGYSSKDAERLCLTTPATILGKNFDRPTSCPHTTWSGYWGVWDVEDETCR